MLSLPNAQSPASRDLHIGMSWQLHKEFNTLHCPRIIGIETIGFFPEQHWHIPCAFHHCSCFCCAGMFDVKIPIRWNFYPWGLVQFTFCSLNRCFGCSNLHVHPHKLTCPDRQWCSRPDYINCLSCCHCVHKLDGHTGAKFVPKQGPTFQQVVE